MSDDPGPHRSRSVRLPAIWLLLLGAVYCTTAGGEAMDAKPLPVSEAMGELKSHQTKAEHHAALLKGMYRDAEVPKSVYRHAEGLYVEAQAAIDGWVERVIVDLESGLGPEISEPQRKHLEYAGIQAETFIQFVAELPGDSQRSAWVEALGAVPETLTALVDSGIKLWRESSSLGKSRREALIRRLEELRWTPFTQIAAATPAPGGPGSGSGSGGDYK